MIPMNQESHTRHLRPVIYNLRLDAKRNDIQASIVTKKGDRRSRLLRMRIYEDTAPFFVEEKTMDDEESSGSPTPHTFPTPPVSALVKALKPDGMVVLGDCIYKSGVFEYMLPGQMLAASGLVQCEMTVYGGEGEVLTTPRFEVYVEDVLYEDDIVESTNEFSALTDTMRRLISLKRDVVGLYDEVREAYEDGSLHGKDGKGFQILGLYPNINALEEEHPEGEPGDVYAVGTAVDNTLYLWDTNTDTWTNIGSLQGLNEQRDIVSVATIDALPSIGNENKIYIVTDQIKNQSAVYLWDKDKVHYILAFSSLNFDVINGGGPNG